jgi:Arc/MetJ-type ribon-helix-helix transcriptional regulator
MSGVDEEIERIRKEVEKRIDELSNLLDSHFSRVSEIEEEIVSEKERGKLWDRLLEIRSLKDEVKVEKIKIKEDLVNKVSELKKKIRESYSGAPKEALEAALEKLENLADFLDEKLDGIEDRMDSFFDKVEEVEDRIKDKIKEKRKYFIYAESPRSQDITIRIPEIKIPDIGNIVNEAISKVQVGGPSVVVSSVRLPETDLKLIDALVDAGIFKSRNEGIVFFAHRGIESSKEWLVKVKEKLDEIRKLQEEAKAELEKIISGQTEKKESKEESKEEGSSN